MERIITVSVGIIMIAGGLGHVFTPDMYAPMIPSFIPATIANIVAACVEMIIGVAILVPKFSKYGGLGFAILMIAFLPIHILDLLKETPVVGSKAIAIARLLIQVILIYTGWWIYKAALKRQDVQ